MLTAALVLAGLGALVHVYIFWLEALAFESAGRRVFGVSAADVPAMKPWALNQGFYNLFLAVGTTIGIAISHTNRDAGLALVLLGASLVLVTSDPTKARGAVVQGAFPAVCLLLLAVWAWA